MIEMIEAKMMSSSIHKVMKMLIVLGVAVGLASAATADQPTEIRVGVLKFGTVNWELNTLVHHGLDRKSGFALTIMPYANPRATQVALLGDAVDVIVTDWVWVSRQRYGGGDFTFIPYSKSVGALIAAEGADISALADLKGKRLGVAGGPLDKSWLLAQAYLHQNGNQAVLEGMKPTYGAPPLLNALVAKGDLDAVLTYWHFAARLEASGLKRVVGVADIARALGIDIEVPFLGYAFRDGWAKDNEKALLAFAQALRDTRALLATDAGEWQRLRPLLRVDDDKTADMLRSGFLAGTVTSWGERERAAIDKLYQILVKTGGPAYSKGKDRLAPGTFWAPLTY